MRFPKVYFHGTFEKYVRHSTLHLPRKLQIFTNAACFTQNIYTICIFHPPYTQLNMNNHALSGRLLENV